MADPASNAIYLPDSDEAPLLALTQVSIRPAMPLSRLSFRGHAEAQKAAGAALGFDLPQAPLSATVKDGKAALWLGPDEWMILAAEADLDTLQASLSKKIGEAPHALVDISHRQGAVIIEGAKAEWLLNSGIPIDLHGDAFPFGMVTRTVFQKSPIMIWHTGPDSFVVEAWGSFLGYVTGLLCEAAEELEAA